MYGGDESAALVVDVGYDSTKAGYAGEDCPKMVFSSALGVLPAEDGSTRYSVDEMHFPTPGLEASSAFSSDGLISDWQGYEQIWTHALRNRLRVESCEHPLMVAEATANTRAVREKQVQVLFEKFSPPALFLARHSVLASFAVGRPSSLVIDCGASGTVVSAVHDGYALSKCYSRSPLGGAALTDLTLHSVLSAGGAAVRPRYTFKRALRDGAFVVTPTPCEGVTSSYHNLRCAEIAADVKESVCRLCEGGPLDEAAASLTPSVPYELPDGNLVECGVERLKIPELLFRPQLLGSIRMPMDLPPGSVADLLPASATLRGLPAAAIDVVNRCDLDLRRELLSGVVLTGGGSLFGGLKERLERELSASAPAQQRCKVLASASSAERRYGVWLGGSILASLGSFQQLWMSKAEYEEHGAGYINRKCP